MALQEAEKVAVDWHHTLEWHDNVSPQNIRALDALKDAGYQVYLCSFQATKRLSWKVWQGWEKQIYTTEKTGNYGKAQACYYHNIKTVFDDTWEVIDECSRWGVETYPVVSKWDEKYWEGIDTYRSFAQAVQAFLDKRLAETLELHCSLTKGRKWHPMKLHSYPTLCTVLTGRSLDKRDMPLVFFLRNATAS